MKLFQKNKNIIKKGYVISKSKSSKLLGNGTNYFDMFEYVEIYSEEFSYLNTTLIKENNNNYELSELILVRIIIQNH